MTPLTPPQRVVVTRPVGRGAELSREIERLGIEVVSLPLLVYRPPADEAPLRRALARNDYDVWVFTSAEAVRRSLGQDPLAPPASQPRILAVGSATRKALVDRGLSAVEEPDTQRAEGIVELLEKTLTKPSRILFPRASDARAPLTRGLRAAGHRVDDPVAYDKILPLDAADQFRSLLGRGPLGWIIFTSPRIVRHFVELVGADWPRRRDSLVAVSIGPVTSETLQKAGVPTIIEAKTPSDRSLIHCLIDPELNNC